MQTESHIIYTAGGGRLGNQLLNSAHLLAFAMEHPKFKLINLAFSQFAAEYGNEDLAAQMLNRNNLERPWALLTSFCDYEANHIFPWHQSKWLRLKLLHRIAALRPDSVSIIGGNTHTRTKLAGERYDYFDMTDLSNVNYLKDVPVSVIAGWNVRAWSLIEKHREQIQSTLQPGDDYQNIAEQFITSQRSKFDVLVGVLMRQGDYRSWQNGRYYFNSNHYHKVITQFCDEFGDVNVGVIIASDQPQSDELFCSNQFAFTTGIAGGTGHYIESFAELALCDVVISPPSTFSALAAFVGNVPIIPLYKETGGGDWEVLNQPLIESANHPIMSAAVN